MNTSDIRVSNLLGAIALHVTGQVRDAVNGSVAHSGMTADAVVIIKDQPGSSMDWLGQALGLSQPGTVHLVNKLTGLGWVDKRPGADARSRALHLTATGHIAAADILAARQAVLDELVARLSPEQQRHLSDIAARLLVPSATDDLELAHICRLCDRSCCSECPAHLSYLHHAG